jgi:hypothetical protein
MRIKIKKHRFLSKTRLISCRVGTVTTGDLVALDGSLIDATLSMCWADYRKRSKKAKIHLGFDLNHSIPSKTSLPGGSVICVSTI